MSIKTDFFNLKKRAASVDWKLLAFLILFLNVKIGVKVFALILIYLLQFDFKLGFSFKNSRLPLFYPIAIVIAVFNWIIYSGYTNFNYNLVFFSGIGFWLLCILAMHQVKLAVDRNKADVIHNTILIFFLLNAAVSMATLFNIVREIHTINPYRYQGQYQKYFIGTGDYIKGLTFDVSTTNAVLNAFGVIYFLIRKNAAMLLLCMAVMLLTGSNSLNLMLAGVLALLFIFNTTKDQKSLIVVCLMFLAVFMFKVSPQNDEYMLKIYSTVFHKKVPVVQGANTPLIRITDRPDSTLNPDERKEKIAQLYLDSLRNIAIKKKESVNKPLLATKPNHFIPGPNIDTEPYQHKDSVTIQLLTLRYFIDTHQASLPFSRKNRSDVTLPGKVIAMQQTLSFLRYHPAKILTGNGIGNFSSKIAFKASGLGFAGKYPVRYAYISNSFLTLHLDVYLNFFTRTAGLHSLINSPNSVYDQLLGEYGLLGLLGFFICYIGYFLKHYKKLTYGIPLLILMMGVFFLDYWFEQLSVVVFFELMLLLNIKETEIKTLSDGKE
jgi:hypothetical protein